MAVQRALRRIAVVGPGAMGSLFAQRLAEAGCDVTLVDHRPERAARLQREGLSLSDARGLRHSRPRVAFAGDVAPDCELIVIATKAARAGQALAGLRGILSDDTRVLAIQNGWTAWADLNELLPPQQPLYLALTTEGARRGDDGVVRHAGGGPTWLGRRGGFQEPAAEDSVVRLLRAADFAVQPVADVEEALWRKLAISAGINAVTAILGLDNGELLDTPALEVGVAAACEAQAVARARGLAVHEDAAAEIRAVLKFTAGNRSSMLEDVRAGRPTEIEAIQGAVIREAMAHGLEVPVNRVLWALARTLEGRAHGDR